MGKTLCKIGRAIDLLPTGERSTLVLINRVTVALGKGTHPLYLKFLNWILPNANKILGYFSYQKFTGLAAHFITSLKRQRRIRLECFWSILKGHHMDRVMKKFCAFPLCPLGNDYFVSQTALKALLMSPFPLTRCPFTFHGPRMILMVSQELRRRPRTWEAGRLLIMLFISLSVSQGVSRQVSLVVLQIWTVSCMER